MPDLMIPSLLLGGAALAAPYWRHRRTRPTPAVLSPADVPTLDVDDYGLLVARVTARWQRVAVDKPGGLPGAWLESIRPVPGGWAATVVAPDGTLDPDAMVSPRTRGRVAGAFRVGVGAVTLTADPDDANRATVMVQPVNPLAEGITWDGTGIDPDTGSMVVATASDGTPVRWPLWQPGWGAVHQLMGGATGAGKSEFLNLLLAGERMSDRVVSWVGDPQLGQSLGDLRDAVDWFAPTVEEILTMLRAAKYLILARNVATSRMRYSEVRPDGTVVQRRMRYRDVSPSHPLVTITIDEAHLPMPDPDHGQEIVKLMALIAKTGRKSNVLLRPMVQGVLLTELKDSVLRAQLSSGAVVCFRTADKLTGAAAWPGRMPGDPVNLPKLPGSCYISSGPPIPARTHYPGDLWDILTSGETLGIEADAAAAIDASTKVGKAGTVGGAYTGRRKRLAEFDDLDPAVLMGLADQVAAAQVASQEASTADRVLAVLAESGAPMTRRDIDAALRPAVKARTLTKALADLTTRPHDCSPAAPPVVKPAGTHGVYQITPEALEAYLNDGGDDMEEAA